MTSRLARARSNDNTTYSLIFELYRGFVSGGATSAVWTPHPVVIGSRTYMAGNVARGSAPLRSRDGYPMLSLGVVFVLSC